MNVDFTINLSNLLVIIGGLFATGKWLYELVQKYKWEKNKYLLEKLEEFRLKDNTKVVHQLLDWNKSWVEIEEIKFKVDDNFLIASLDLHIDRSSFKKEELLLRNTFDRYFDDLNTMFFMVKVGLINEKYFINFMEYWFKFLRGEGNKPKIFGEAISKYMIFYGYKELYDFIKENDNGKT